MFHARLAGLRSFGGGVDICFGARLARLQGEVAFRPVMERLPNLELDAPDKPQWRQTFTLRGLERLEAHW